MKKTLFTLFILASIAVNAQIKFTTVNPVTKGITIKNFGSAQVDISTYRLCAMFEYKTLNQAGVTIISGDFVLSPGEEVSVKWNSTTGFNTTNSDLGLYLPTGNFTDASSMVAFMEYNAGMLGREDVAVTAGYWVVNTFVSGTGPFYYTGDGVQSGAQYWSTQMPGEGNTPAVVINEIDVDQTGVDAAEFVELYGVPNTPLDGIVVVFINGADNLSYRTFSLNGYSLDDNGFFVLGNSSVPGVSIGVTTTGILQNGADAVAIYQGNAANWPNGTAATANNLIDAVVYDTDQSDDDLIGILTPGQPQLNENELSSAITNSLSRVPDGGAPFMTSLYVIQAPTPNATNVIPVTCQGANVSAADNTTSITICSDGVIPLITFINTSTAPLLTPYVYVVANSSNLIISIDEDGVIDFTSFANGELHVWGLSYTGNLDPLTTVAGLPVSSITSDECSSLSTNFVTVSKSPCLPSPCNGGTILSDTGLNYLTYCIDGNSDLSAFTHSPETPLASYNYVVTNAGGAIVLVSSGAIDFDLLPAGTYYVWGLSFDGTLDPSTTEPGDLASAILTDGSCIALSSNSVLVTTQVCTLVEGCTELFISEYMEGVTGTNKAIEIYNPTNFTVDLSSYSIKTYNNGSSVFTYVIPLAGTLEAGGTHIVVNPSSDQALIDIADQTSLVASFNGNDAVELLHSDVVIDVIGTVGIDPGVNGWPAYTGSTKDHDLVRKSSVTSPTNNWSFSTAQWDIYPGSDWSHLGNHMAVACTDIPQIGFTTTVITTEEDAGSVVVSVQAYNIPAPIDITVDVSASNADAGIDYTSIFPLTLNFASGTSVQTFTVDIIDDIIDEDDEYITLTLGSGTPVNWVQQDINIIINHNDLSYPYYEIAEISGIDVNGLLDSIGVFCELRGIVHGINFNPTGVHFHLLDDTDGIKVFSALENFGYTVQEGDSISVTGELFQFMGQAEIHPDQITVFDQNHPLYSSNLTTILTESDESHLVTLRCVQLVNPSEWSNTGNGFVVQVTDGTNINKVRIDGNTELFGSVAPTGHFTVTGIVEQADNTSPYNSDYSLWMRYAADFTENVIAGFESIDPLEYGDLGAQVTFNNSSVGAETYEWDFGDDASSDEEFPEHLYDYNWLAAHETFVVTLIATNDLNCSDTHSMAVDAVYVGIAEQQAAQIQIYPNPFSDIIHLNSPSLIHSYQCLDQAGKVVASSYGLNTNNMQIDLSALSSGIYTLQINADPGSSFYRIVRN